VTANSPTRFSASYGANTASHFTRAGVGPSTFCVGPNCNVGCRQAKRAAKQLILMAANDMLLEHILFVCPEPGR